MIYNYYKRKEKYFKILDILRGDLLTDSEIKSVKANVKKMNEYHFFNLLNDLIYYKSIHNLTIKELSCFFITEQKVSYENYLLPFMDSFDDNKHVYETYLSLNFRNELENIVDYLINTKEYPKSTLRTKLLYLKDCMYNDNFLMIECAKESFISYCDNIENSNENSTKISFSLDVIGTLNEYENELNSIIKKINKKIDSLNTVIPKRGNYLVDLDNELLKDLYSLLEKNMFIDQNKTTQNQFIQVLKSNWEDHNSIIHLEMDNRQFYTFISKMDEYLGFKISIPSIEFAENIENKNGKIKANSIYSSKSGKIIPPKRETEIDYIIKKIKSKV